MITPESKKEIKKLNKLRSNMQNLKLLPARLVVGVIITFFLYCLSAIVDTIGLISPSTSSSDFTGIIFIIATGTFFVVGAFALIMVLVPLVNEF